MLNLTQLAKRQKPKQNKKNNRLFEFISFAFIVTCLFIGLKGYTEGSNSLTFAQISDVHYSSLYKADTGYRMLVESGDLLKDAIEQVNAVPDVDFVMFTGDMINTPSKDELYKFLDIVKTINAPWYAVFGNHDISIGGYLSKENYLTILRENNPNMMLNAPKPYYAFEPKPGFKVIGLDTIIDNRLTSNGNLYDEELKFLDNEIANAKDDVILVFMHGPILEPLHSPSHSTINADKAMAIFKKYNNPIGVFTGHYHTTKITKKDNVLYVCTPAMISYPDAFRIINVKKDDKIAIFDIKFMETNLKEVQAKAKSVAFGARIYYGASNDRSSVYTIEKK